MINLQKVSEPKIIKGNQFKDHRGVVSFVNDFDMSLIKRMYTIKHSSVDVVRAWQGHKVETKYFKCLKGSFLFAVVPINNWVTPSKNLVPKKFILEAKKNEILNIPKGFANGFKALEVGSELLVFSDKDLNDSKNDQYKFNENLWMNW